MLSKKNELLEILEKIAGTRVLVAGDLILDRYMWGNAERISDEAPVPIVALRKTEDRLGCAGNVVRNLTNLAAKVSVCGFIGADDEGQRILQLLEAAGADRDGVLIDRTFPTSLKTRVIARGQQVVRIDREELSERGTALREGFAAILEAHLDAAQAVILSDYGKGTLSATAFERLSKAKAEGRLGCGVRPLVLDPHPRNYDLYHGISIAKPNRREAEAASGIKISDHASALHAAKVLLKRWDAEMMMITLGEDGLVILTGENDRGLILPTEAREVFDVSGAGDTVTAVYAAALAAGASPLAAGDLANIAAGIVVSEVGTVAIERARLEREICRLAGEA